MQDSIFTNQEYTINHIEIKSTLLIHVIQLFEYSFKIFIKYRQNKLPDPHIQVPLIMQLIHLAGFWYMEIAVLVTQKKIPFHNHSK